MCDIINVPRHFHKCVFKSDATILQKYSILKEFFEYAKTKSQQRFNAFVFTTWIIQSLYFLYPKFQASVATAWFVSDLVGNSENSFFS